MSTITRRTLISSAGVLGVGLAVGSKRWTAAQDEGWTDAQTGQIETEGDTLAFDIRGHGDPLLLIPGTPGDASNYLLVAQLLAPDYTVITYDPRGFGRSTGRDPQNYEIGQQARDAVRVLSAAGYDAALIFGSSAGAVVGLELARNHPEAVTGLIAHEAPVVRVLPDAAQVQTQLAEIYLAGWTDGPKPAFLQFLKYAGIPANNGVPFTDDDIAQILPIIDSIPVLDAAVNYVPYQMLPLSNYKPDVQIISDNGVKVVMAAGELSSDSLYGRTAPLLAEQLNGSFMTLPGHHLSYQDPGVVDAWVAKLRETLAEL